MSNPDVKADISLSGYWSTSSLENHGFCGGSGFLVDSIAACQSSPDRGQSRKIRLRKFRGSGL